MNLSFAGCGFLGIYHVGVACCFRKYAPHLLLNKISGASIGAVAACSLLLDLPIGETTSGILRVATEARKKSLGPLNPSFNIHQLLLEGLEKFLPDDAHIKVNGKLHISLTRVRDGKNVIVSQFDSREELIQALLASAFIPIFSGLFPPKFKGVRYMDGGYSDNLPTLDENTITVSPFCGESDICPRDDSSQLFHINVANTSIEVSKQNIYRMLRILFPPHPERLANMCKQGFDDALRFLHRNNLINCTKCLAVQSTFVVSETLEESIVYDPQCKDCKRHRQEALVSNIPDAVHNVFQEVIDSANKGLLNWVFKHRGMKLLSVLSLPYTLPADIVYATFTKIMANAPQVGNTLWDVSKVLLDQLSSMLHRVNRKSQQISAKITCQLAFTEYNGISQDHQADSIGNKMNLNFTLNLDDSDDMPLDHVTEHQLDPTKEVLQRKPSFTFSKTDTMDDDTFDNILEVTSHHDAVMAYYYLDENDKVKVTEIFDVTDNESSCLQTPQEQQLNQNLEFDDSFTIERSPQWAPPLDDQISQYSFEDLLDNEENLFSEPESEWTGSCTVEEPEDEPNFFSNRTNCSLEEEIDNKKNESESCDAVKNKSSHIIPSFTYEEFDV